MYNLGIWIARLRISHFRATRATPFVACVPWPPTTVRTLLVLVRGTLWSPNPITWTGIECSTTVSGPIFFREIPSESAMATLEIGPEVLRLVPPSPPPPPPPPRKHRSMVWFHAWSIGLGFFELLKKITILPSCFFFTKPEWIYMSISLSSFLALVFVCIVGVVILKYCYILCR